MKQRIAGYALIAIGAGLAVLAIPAWQNAPQGIAIEEIDFAAWRVIMKAQALAFGAAAGLVIGISLVVTAYFAPNAAKVPPRPHSPPARPGIGLFGPWVMILSGIAIAIGFPLVAHNELDSMQAQFGTIAINPDMRRIGMRMVYVVTAIHAVPLFVGGLVLLRRAQRERGARG